MWAWMSFFNGGKPSCFPGHGVAQYTRNLQADIDNLPTQDCTAVAQRMGNRLEMGNATISDSVNVNFPAMAHLVDNSVTSFCLYMPFKMGYFTGTPGAGLLGTSNSPL